MVETEKIRIEKTKNSRLSEVDFDHIPFGKQYSDHMFVADYANGEWNNPRIVPYANMQISPASQALHYGVSVFEGMKAYKHDGRVLLFRPLRNHERLNKSAKRLCIPDIPEDIFMDGMNALLKLDAGWVPDKENTSLYVRPVMFSTEEYIGIKASEAFRFMIITCPVGAYYSNPVSVKIETKYARAVAGGTGYAKAAGNYAGSLYPTKLANEMGYDQLIWTDGKEHKYIEEAGTMNLFFIINGVLVTPALTDTFLHGITRDSIIELARDMGYSVEERQLSVEELLNALYDNKIDDAFGVGTAATVTHISSIGHDGLNYHLPDVSERTISLRIRDELEAIKTGKTNDRFGWVHEVK